MMIVSGVILLTAAVRVTLMSRQTAAKLLRSAQGRKNWVKDSLHSTSLDYPSCLPRICLNMPRGMRNVALACSFVYNGEQILSVGIRTIALHAESDERTVADVQPEAPEKPHDQNVMYHEY